MDTPTDWEMARIDAAIDEALWWMTKEDRHRLDVFDHYGMMEKAISNHYHYFFRVTREHPSWYVDTRHVTDIAMDVYRRLFAKVGHTVLMIDLGNIEELDESIASFTSHVLDELDKQDYPDYVKNDFAQFSEWMGED